jgi:hypothetical protein
MPLRRRKNKPAPAPAPPPVDEVRPDTEVSDAEAEPEPEEDDIEVPELEAEAEEEEEEEEEVGVVSDDEVLIEAEELGEDDAETLKPAPVVRPLARPTPGRPPSAKEEPEPPFNVGERVVLIRNTRPRTGTPIGDHPVGAPGRVETVLSQTAIVRFDRAPDIKEVVAFSCLESTDEKAKAQRAKRERELARQAAEAETKPAEERPRGR